MLAYLLSRSLQRTIPGPISRLSDVTARAYVVISRPILLDDVAIGSIVVEGSLS